MEKTTEHADSPTPSVDDDTRLETNDSEVAAKAYDDEVVLMHLGSGVYASIECLGALVWEAIEKRHSLRETADVLAAHYDVEPAQALRDVHTLAAQLLAERLVRTATATEPSGAIAAPVARRAYAAPCLIIYRDMEDLLALDPPLPQYAEAPWRKS